MGRRLILPGQVGRPAGGLTILVPRGYEDPDQSPTPIAVCRVPTGGGEVCGRVFYSGEERAWQKHVGDCARRHEAEIHAQSPRTRLPIFTEEEWDPEVAAHLKRVGEQMIREGRMEMRPNERANG